MPEVLEDYLVAQLPESKTKVEDCSPSDISQDVLGKLVIEAGWHLIEIGSEQSLLSVKHEVRESGDREQDRHSDSIHHSDKSDIHDTRVLEMDLIDWSTIYVNVSLHVCAFSVVGVVLAATVDSS